MRKNNIVDVLIVLNLILFFTLRFIDSYFHFGLQNYILIINLFFTIVYFLSLKKRIQPKNVDLKSLNFTNPMEIRSYSNFGLFAVPVRWTNKAIIYLDKEKFYFYYNLSFLSNYFYGPFEIDYLSESRNSKYKLDEVQIEGQKGIISFSHRKFYSKYKIVLKLRSSNDVAKLKFIQENHLKFRIQH